MDRKVVEAPSLALCIFFSCSFLCNSRHFSLSACSPLCPSMFPMIYLYPSLSIDAYVSIYRFYLPIYLSAHLSTISFHLSIQLSISLPLLLTIHRSVYHFIYRSVCLSILTASYHCVVAIFSSPHLQSTAPATKKTGQVIRSAAPVTQNHLSKPEGLML